LSVDIDFLIRSIISLLVITAAFDPIKIIFFNQAIAEPKRDRIPSAVKVAFYILIVLGGAAIIGRQFLDIIGINLDAFSAVGGLIIALMGFEMLYGGGTSKAQGNDVRDKGPEEGDALLIPLTLPLIAGPGAITTTITIAAQGDSILSIAVALTGVCVVALSAFISFAWLGDFIGRARPETVVLMARLGGLLLATIGTQMMLNGLRSFLS